MTPTHSSKRRRSGRRATRRSVIWTDRGMSWLISTGGLLVIFAVLGIFVYLVQVAWPLFRGGSVQKLASYRLLPENEASSLLLASLDEYRAVGFYLSRDGRVVYFDARNGNPIATHALFEDITPLPALTAFSGGAGDSRVAFGFADGSVRVGTLGFETTFITAADTTSENEALSAGETIVLAGAITERTTSGQLRTVEPAVIMEPAIPIGSSDAVTLLDYRSGDRAEFLAVYKATGELLVNEVARSVNFMSGETTTELYSRALDLPAQLAPRGPASFLLITSPGDQLYLAWRDGTIVRYDLRESDDPRVAEIGDIVPHEGIELTSLSFMLGEQSIIAGDSAGGVRAWFRVESPTAATTDGFRLIDAHDLPADSSAITTLGMSLRDKTFVTGSAAGVVTLRHMTSEQKIARAWLDGGRPIVSATITPKGDGVFAVDDRGEATLFALANAHPETTLKSIFGRIWYEGYSEPEYTWQSSSGTDDFEPKFSLIPLIFGTFKATFYALLFAIPIAILGAIYTSEFLEPNLRTPVKSTIEMMASLPSVVLGFIAALVLAPLVENWVVAVLIAFGLIPVVILAFGYLWQLLPVRLALRFSGKSQLVILLALIGGTIFLGAGIADGLERLIFHGDFKAWLDGRTGSGAPGIAVAVWPLLFTALVIFDRYFLIDPLSRRMAGVRNSRVALADAGKFFGILLLSIAGAWLAGWLGASLGLDLRGVLFGTYVQRNALIVGFVMGFAVIPIIYTIAEDALSAVPQSLRSASLGCGATRWQTATRVILPVALSGIFSAVMIGLGRAVGETMIVLMAAGNTPLLEMNIFNGLRTLSANIAVELPEAVKDGTLYRMLFLAALTLFIMTFFVNTLAEIIRQRFRKRAFQL